MIDHIYDYMIHNNMIGQGDRILAAVSGGADSMCLLEVLRELRDRTGLQLRVLHVHHGLRESAEDDLLYVQKYCADAGVPFEAVRVDAAGYAAESRMSVEEAARHLRYKALEEAAQAWDRECRRDAEYRQHEGCGKDEERSADAVCSEDARGSACRIAVAHHLEDQAETVLFNLVRGSRLRGLQGMLPVNGRIIRPLLTCSRAQIEEYLTRRGILWREDETNRDTRYARNLLRLQVMPLLEEINKEAGAHIARAAEEAAQAESFLREETKRAAARCCRETEAGLVLSAGALLREPALIGRRVVYEAIASAAGRKKDLQDTHVQSVLGLARKSGSGRVDVYSGVRVVKSYDDLLVCKAQENPAQADPQTFPSGAASDVRKWPLDAAEYRCRVLDFDGDLTSVPRKQYTKWLDYDKIGALPIFRTRREGDRIVLDESGRSKSAARYMIDGKVPRGMRDRIVLPTAGSDILWIPSGRISAAFMVSSGTRRVLEISWEPSGETATEQGTCERINDGNSNLSLNR